MAPTTRSKNGHAKRLSCLLPIPKDVLVELSPKHNKKCMFCGQKEISETLYGYLYQLNDVIVHYFCTLFSSRVFQNGTNKEDGIFGFLLEDILIELNRRSKVPCYYCNNLGASISCCELKCQKIFHLPCGLKNGSMHQYFQSFKSFCHQHHVTQTISMKELQNSDPVQCGICKENTVPIPSPTSLWAPCCSAWFHRQCIQNLALTARYSFKCPLCNNVDKFKSRMLILGIYVPSSFLKKINHNNASQETVSNVYPELEKYSTCNAKTCLCPFQEKRNFQQEIGPWQIILCFMCGNIGTHILCNNLKCNQQWICTECKRADRITFRRQIFNVTINHRKKKLSNIISQTLTNTRYISQNLENNVSSRQIRNFSDKIQKKNETLVNTSTPIEISDISDNNSDEQIIHSSILKTQPSTAAVAQPLKLVSDTNSSTLEFPTTAPRSCPTKSVIECVDLTNSDDESDV